MLAKFTSRKFLIALSGIITGVIMIINKEVGAGTTTILTAIITYIIAEGIIDAKALLPVITTVKEVAQNVEENLNQTIGFIDEQEEEDANKDNK